MKKIFTILLCSTILIAFSNIVTEQSLFFNSDNSLARVKTVSGKLVFYNNEPIEKYEIVFSFENAIPNYEHINNQKVMDVSVQNAMKESGLQGGKFFDGIICSPNAKRDLAIKFKNDTTDNAIARVSKINGKYVFMECEPVNDYEIVENLIKAKAKTRQEYIDKLIKTAYKKEKKGKVFDGIIFGSTKYDNSIKF